MKIVYFTHSLASCWNHGNAHFLRGVLRELIALGHEVVAYEPEKAWSLENLLKDHGEEGLEPWRAAYPELSSTRFGKRASLSAMIEGADLVIVHEWNDHDLVARLGRLRARGGRFTLLFHDTHHRAVSEPKEMKAYDLSAYDGVLAFGETLAEVYRRWGWGGRVFTWHEAADLRHFHPPAEEGDRDGLVWIGNWGEGERTKELKDYLFRPARAAGLKLDVWGVRYHETAKATVRRYGGTYHGWLANAEAPDVFARFLATIHVPRRYYTKMLPGIPTIRVFEALACGIPLLCAPWDDAENLFRPGEDYLVAKDGEEMTRRLTQIRSDPDLRRSLAASGYETIRARHSCAHRAEELMTIYAKLNPSPVQGEGGTRDAQASWGGEGTQPGLESVPSPSQPSAGPLPLPERERGLSETSA
ncbi:MAG TPA: glycosyltransferase [Allosphingosinicella sp.]|nr:glycosyltransferase [Allosphingosinicella sp.]